MRIAVIGAYGSGKSTLTDQLAAAAGLPVSRATPMARPVGSSSVAASQCTPAELVQLTVRRLVERSVEEDRFAGGFVSDGSVLHDWIYAETLLAHGSFPTADATHDDQPLSGTDDFTPLAVLHQLELLGRHELAARYDLWLYLPIEFTLRDPEPPISESFRAITDTRVRGAATDDGADLHVVRGTPTERLTRALELVDRANVP